MTDMKPTMDRLIFTPGFPITDIHLPYMPDIVWLSGVVTVGRFLYLTLKISLQVSGGLIGSDTTTILCIIVSLHILNYPSIY